MIAYKREWPTWTPPSEMIDRQPELEQYRNGMPPGLENPLGARALYIFKDGRDTLYRLHGNPDERSSARRSPAAACGCCSRTSSICTAGCRAARRSSSSKGVAESPCAAYVPVNKAGT